MERLACFVYASGGVVRIDEINGFLEANDAVKQSIMQAAAPTRALKRIVLRLGGAVGLQWLDSDPSDARRENACVALIDNTPPPSVDVSRVPLWIPRSLQVVEDLVRSRGVAVRSSSSSSDAENECVARRLSIGELKLDLASDWPQETAFMKRRSGGIVPFLRRYGAHVHGLELTSAAITIVSSASTACAAEAAEVVDSARGKDGLVVPALARSRRPERVIRCLQVVFAVFVLERHVRWPPSLPSRRPLAHWRKGGSRCRRSLPAATATAPPPTREPPLEPPKPSEAVFVRLLVPTRNGPEWRLSCRRPTRD